ncbi:MAG: hypothetical protein F6K08_21245 [Okeania sp. SIO1H6]|uniref:hypothetical protein n=1 Tax=Okeania sp. SIO1H5 TaxID=2607777 RepID=UPI0013C621AF|nr:hypothetical protein [Okeania sp. SIO1H5]NES75942.1 hypothetical protein [Okeania sp. SIO1H4]NET15174.1 hypothetical protein [Okeania sp. SIO1H6]
MKKINYDLINDIKAIHSVRRQSDSSPTCTGKRRFASTTYCLRNNLVTCSKYLSK